MAQQVLLTTIDNPYNPFTQWDEWYSFDESHGYCTSGYLARIASTSKELSDDDNDEIINDAIDEIVKLNPLGIHIKVTPETAKTIKPVTLAK